MRKAMLLYATGDAHGEMHRMTLPSKVAYAERHGYDLVTPGVVVGNRHPSWEKVAILRGLLDEYEQVLFLGADVLIAHGHKDIAADVPREAWQALVVHDIDSMPGTPRVGYVPNCDIWLVQRGMEPWLERMDKMSVALAAHPWWEQAANMALMGYSIQQPCLRHQPSELWARTYELDARWNWHPYAKCVGEPWFRHATGFPMETRLQMLRDWTAQ